MFRSRITTLIAIAFLCLPVAADEVPHYRVVGDAIPEALTSEKGDPTRGRAIVVNRQIGLCLLCHSGPFPEEPAQGTLGPSLNGVGARWSEGQLRLRLVDAQAANPQTLMPSFHRSNRLRHVAPLWEDRPTMNAQQVEDVVAFLKTLKP